MENTSSYFFKQHIPSFVSGVEPTEFNFKTFEELIEKVERTISELHPNFKYTYGETCTSSNRYLMITSNDGKQWFVLGITDYPLENNISKYNSLLGKKPKK